MPSGGTTTADGRTPAVHAGRGCTLLTPPPHTESPTPFRSAVPSVQPSAVPVGSRGPYRMAKTNKTTHIAPSKTGIQIANTASEPTRRLVGRLAYVSRNSGRTSKPRRWT
jgi:hypothetical protein